MTRKIPATILIALASSALASCGGSTGSAPVGVVSGAVSATGSGAPAPTPTPTPTPSPTPDPTPATETADASDVQPAATGKRILLVDKQFYGAGQFLAYASPWCAYIDSKLKIGVDLVNTISFMAGNFPNGVDITASAPNENPNLHGCGVYGYHFAAYGNYDGGAAPVAVTPRQVSSITSFTQKFSWHPVYGAADNYNVLNEFYVTSVAGVTSGKVAEIGLMLHASASAAWLAKSGTQIGTWTDDSGRVWKVSQVKKFIIVIPADGKDARSGSIDFGKLLKFLVSRGVLTGKEWVNGAAIGLEPVIATSAITVDSWSIALK